MKVHIFLHNFAYIPLVPLILTLSMETQYFTDKICSSFSKGQKDFHVKFHNFKCKKMCNFAHPLLNATNAPIHLQLLYIFHCAPSIVCLTYKTWTSCGMFYTGTPSHVFGLPSQPGFHRSSELLYMFMRDKPPKYGLIPLGPRLLLGKILCCVKGHGEVIMVCTRGPPCQSLNEWGSTNTLAATCSIQ